MDCSQQQPVSDGHASKDDVQAMAHDADHDEARTGDAQAVSHGADHGEQGAASVQDANHEDIGTTDDDTEGVRNNTDIQGEHAVSYDPPYSHGDRPEDGLVCYQEGCTFESQTWSAMLQHQRTRHGIGHSKLKGSYLYTVARAELNEQQNERNRRKRGTDTASLSASARIHAKSAAKKKGRSGDEFVELSSGAPCIWMEMRCLVKCDGNLNPVTPFEAIQIQRTGASGEGTCIEQSAGGTDSSGTTEWIARESCSAAPVPDTVVSTDDPLPHDQHPTSGSIVSHMVPSRSRSRSDVRAASAHDVDACRSMQQSSLKRYMVKGMAKELVAADTGEPQSSSSTSELATTLTDTPASSSGQPSRVVWPSSPRGRKPIPAEKVKMYAEFSIPRLSPCQRLRVDKAAHGWMEKRLQEWQEEHSKGPADLPSNVEWYLDARIDCIKAGLITMEHSNDVVRSYLRNLVKRLSCITTSGAPGASNQDDDTTAVDVD